MRLQDDETDRFTSLVIPEVYIFGEEFLYINRQVHKN
jgi:hypothetical protein